MPVLEHPDEDRNTAVFILNAIRSARAAIFGMTLFTVINLAVLLFQGDSVLPFALSVPFCLTWAAQVLEHGAFGLLTWGALGISLVILSLFFLCGLLSRKHLSWLTAALILAVADLVLYVGFLLWLTHSLSMNIVEILIKGMLLVILARGVTNARRLRQLSENN